MHEKGYPSDIKASAKKALGNPPEPSDDRVAAMLDNPDRIRAAREDMAKTWERCAHTAVSSTRTNEHLILTSEPHCRRKSHTERLLEGLEKQMQSGQAASKEETDKLRKDLNEWSSTMLSK